MKGILVWVIFVLLAFAIMLAADYWIATADIPVWMKFALLK